MYRLYIFTLILWLPLAQGLLRFVSEPELRGEVSKRVENVSVGMQEFMDGKLQEHWSTQFENALGFRKLSIKLNNTINAFIFREYTSGSGTGVVIGKDRELFEEGPLRAYKISAIVPQQTLEEKVEAIVATSEWLRVHGVEMILLISPSKVAAHQGNVPGEWDLHEGYRQSSSYLRMLKLLEGRGVNIIDSPMLLDTVRQRRKVPMFPKSGTHWNYVAACEVASNLTLKIDELLPETTGKVLCGDVVTRRKPKGDDDDLLEVMNIYYEGKFRDEQYYYPLTFHDLNKVNKKPNVLIIGSSYIWQLLRILDKHELFEPLDFYYYFTRHHRDGVGEMGFVDRSPEGLRKDLLSRDIVLVETNEVVMAQAGFEFFEHVAALAKE